MSSSSHSQNPGVPQITTMRGYVEAVNELRDLTPVESRDRMYDLLTGIVGYVEDQARAKVVERAVRAEVLRKAEGVASELFDAADERGDRAGAEVAEQIADRLARMANETEGGAS
ncbi:hypothetical protein [Streptomyces sp. NPDC055243]|uniref:hypothetical protein n=1 Tax=Streptomyces sp. NPDC055243 TaxID=3365720 RepID=UPI0037D8AA09